MSTLTRLSVVIPTHNPHQGRLGRTLEGLRAQSLLPECWEVLVVDNASSPPIDKAALVQASGMEALHILSEPILGLTNARMAGLSAARGEIAVLVDDDNVLHRDYLSAVLSIFDAHPQVGAIGGRSLPEFEAVPAEWTNEFYGLLALRDLGSQVLISSGLSANEYPAFAPIGAGMAIRRPAWEAWLGSSTRLALSDRKGTELSSGGDNDIVLCVMEAGWEVGYFPTLALTHLIPSGRLQSEYLGRINHGIQKSWMRVLALHHANPWGPLSPAGAFLRTIRAWFALRAWRTPAARIRWAGARGHFEGRIRP